MPDIIPPKRIITPEHQANIKIAKDIQISSLPPLEILERIKALREANKLVKAFPDTGPLRRELYPKQMEFFAAGKDHDERLILAGNKLGKSFCGGFESVVHATGLYPHWWEGKRFEHPTTGWICNNTAIDTRDINQQIILGDAGQFGTGLLPKSVLIGTKSKSSVPDGVELIYIKHVSGGQSVIVTKAYEQGRLKFQGRNIHWIWNDEEVPADVYGEELLRIVVTNGIIFNTYTPILGLTPITVKFLRQSVNKDTLPFKFDDDRKVS